MHLDFLRDDVKSKALRYNVHDYLIRRIHRSIISKMKPTQKDKDLHELLLKKKDDPNYRLFAGNEAVFAKDICKNPEWLEDAIYSNSIRLLMKIGEEETPHNKAAYVNEAIHLAVNAMSIARPQEKEMNNPNYLEFLYRYLTLQVALYFA